MRFSQNYKKNITIEKQYKLHNFSSYKKFSFNVQKSKKNFISLLNNLKKDQRKIIGYGASAKAVTVLNYCNLKEDYFDFFYDTTKQKIGKFLPGTKIKVKEYKQLKDNKIYVFLGAWNFAKEILEKEKFFLNNSGKFITHVPFPRILKKN